MDSHWFVAAASVTGSGHEAEGSKCQDAFAWRLTDDGALITAVCDGAGSSSHGGQAARFVCDALCQSKEIDPWLAQPQSESSWQNFSGSMFRDVKDKLRVFAAESAPGVDFSEFACTTQFLVASGGQVFFAHVGDGRAAVRFEGFSDWRPLFVPCRGDAANETIFLSSDVPFDEAYWAQEAHSWDGAPDAVALMTDGCEMTAFECSVREGEEGLCDPNRPFPGFFDPVAATLSRFAAEGMTPEECDKKWSDFIAAGLPRFAAESDDRTMVFAIRVSSPLPDACTST